jgi:2-haloacid dehalogenase
MRPSVLVFDVNETLLDLSSLGSRFSSIFGDTHPQGEWFARMLHGSLVANHVGAYRPFEMIGVEALMAVAKRRGLDVEESQAMRIVGAMTELPAHPDVIPALERVVDAGFRTAALTNGSTRTANAQIENAGLHVFIQMVISVDQVGRFKPDPMPYRHAADLMEVMIDQTMLVAAHDWDVVGALSAGAQAAYISRPRSVWSLPDPLPVISAPDLGGIADALIG